MKEARKKWLITDEYRGTAVADRFMTLEQVFACTGDKISTDPISHVIKTVVGDKNYYVKRYTTAGKSLRRYFGRSRIRAEWENLIAFGKLGVPIPNIVGFGQKVSAGKFKYGALITEEIVGTADLAGLVRQQPQRLENKPWLYAIINQVADFTRTLHDAGYIHGNLNWRNILVATAGEPAVYFIDCPAGGLKQGRALKRGKLKDLAFLDKLGRVYLSSTDQLRFYKRYKQTDKLSERDKRDIVLITSSLDKHRQRKQQKLLQKKGVKQ